MRRPRRASLVGCRGGARYAADAKRRQHRTAAYYTREARLTRKLDSLDAELPVLGLWRPLLRRLSAWMRRRVDQDAAADPPA